MANIVAIVGRPNVGKSTFFNRLVEKKQAIMDNESGVTRDRHYGYSEWNGKSFTVIDTGGYVEGSEDIFEGAIREQVKEALEEANVILFMVDCHTGLHGLDQDFANVVREIKKPVIIVANKADNAEKSYMASEFYQLGISEQILPIASISGAGTGDLLDEVVEYFEPDPEVDTEENAVPRIAIVGRPNVGKSSFLNALLGKDRSIVTNIAGTTRDAIDSRYNLFGKDFILTDTAGIRKKARVKEDIEFYSVLRAIQALQDSDVCVVVLDATNGIEAQDLNIINLAHKYKKGCVIMVNKWDLYEKDHKSADDYKKHIAEKLGPLSYIPVVFTSVLTKQRIFKVVELALEVAGNKHKKISTSLLNEKMLKEIENYPPPAVRGKHIKIKYITQLPTNSPTFAFFCNHPKDIKESYERFLVNKLRLHFDFEGVPLKAVFRQK
ncbi:ribosome biogenesis GTPase Der [Marinoscillum pacificum]|uniref:ribosome biogenesis GTPase Der n=1 Tax=Marinoscillum pacificum TaxID=392723 RepID=UPI0021579B5B|nr:ribosome biogenesis GTPase Der [Marinoscillum pacificum]